MGLGTIMMVSFFSRLWGLRIGIFQLSGIYCNPSNSCHFFLVSLIWCSIKAQAYAYIYIYSTYIALQVGIGTPFEALVCAGLLHRPCVQDKG